MNPQIQKLIDELCGIDPTFEQHRAELGRILESMIAQKPDVKIDQSFIDSLKGQLAVAAAKQDLQPTKRNYSYLYGGLGALAVVVLIVVFAVQKHSSQKSTQLSGNAKIVAVAPNAFGALNATSLSTTGTQSAAAVAPGMAVPSMAPASASGSVVSSAPQASSPNMLLSPRPIIPIQSSYSYVYTGDPLPTLPANLNVYEKTKTSGQGTDISQLIKQLNFGSLDIGSFGSLQMQSLQASENTPYGYTIGIDGTSGDVSISENWQQWPQSSASQKQLQLSDVPSDDVIIATANQFMKDHGISLDNYGQPQVQNDWKTQIADQSQIYVPDEISMIYPLQLEDKIVYEQQGQVSGLAVNVNIRYNKVSYVSGLTSLNFQSSSYATEQDSSKIIAQAEKGSGGGFAIPASTTTNAAVPVASGSVGVGGGSSGSNYVVQKITYNLGTPTLELEHYWQYNSDGSSNELYIPAYVFPITSSSSGSIGYQQNIVVPVIQSFLEDASNNPPVEVQPLMIPAPAPDVAK